MQDRGVRPRCGRRPPPRRGTARCHRRSTARRAAGPPSAARTRSRRRRSRGSAAGRAGTGSRSRRSSAGRRPPTGWSPHGARPRASPPSRRAAGTRGDHRAGRGQQRAAGVVEVVAVVVVGEQYGVDRAEVGRGDRRAGRACGRGAPPEVRSAARAGRRSGRSAAASPSTSTSAVGPPMWVIRTSVIRRCGRRWCPAAAWSGRPVEHVVGDLLPAPAAAGSRCGVPVVLR